LVAATYRTYVTGGKIPETADNGPIYRCVSILETAAYE
jgi:hypothetical protein